MISAPLGLSVVGCAKKTAPVQYCNSGDSGPVVGQVAQIILSPNLATVGESLNYGQIGQGLSASAQDCKGNAVSVTRYTYASTSSYSNSANGTIFADINPSNGQVCAGTWNRNVGGGIADYTTCTPPTATPRSAIAVNFTTPTAASTVVPSTTTLVFAQATDPISGILSIGVGSGALHTIIPANGTTPAVLASEITSDATFQAEGVSASFNPTTFTLTVTGPVGAGNTLTTTNTALVDNTFTFLAYVTATANGAVSNAIPVYVHAPVTGVVLGNATPGASNGSCPAGTSDPGTDCCPNSTVGTPVAAPVYNGTGCLSQNKTGQLIARVYTGGNTLPANNITCQVGHLTYGTQNASNVVTIDQNGIATAAQPGATAITATIAQSSTATDAGFFSTCSPQSIALKINGQTSTTANIPLNNTLPLTATVLDTAGNPISGISLEFNSTAPQTIPGGAGQVTPAYPGTANITAVCQPNSCNPSGFSQIGIYGNGKPITSNSVTINATGQSSTVLYAGSLQTATSPGSQYLYSIDFTSNQPGSLIKLPYVPNSMVITLSGQSIYMGSSGGLITVTTASNSVSSAVQTVSGSVLSVSPDGSTLVVTDPVRQTISLYGPTGNLLSAYGGVGTRASWSPDNQTVYVTTTTGTILEHGTFTDWQVASPTPIYNDVAVTVPSVGAYFAGPNSTDGRSYCSTTTNITAGNPPTATNTFLPLADSDTAVMDRIVATSDGLHILGAHVAASGAPTFTDMNVTLPIGACPSVISPGYFTSAAFSKPLTTTGSPAVTVGATSITGIIPSSNAKLAFLTYTGTSGLLPVYFVPSQTGFGTLNYVTLSGSATAPLSGVFSTDNLTFYVGTDTDDLIHEIGVTYPTTGSPTAVESGTLQPQLPSASGTGFAPVTVILQRPKKATA